MKFRNWAIIGGLLFAASGSALFEAKHYLEKDKRLEDLVVQAVSPYVNGSFRVGKVDFGFFSAHLKDVTLNLPTDALSITVDEIKVDLSLFKLFRSRFTIAKSINRIVIVGPVIEYSLVNSGDAPKDAPKEAAGSPSKIASIPVGFLSVKKGTIRVRDRNGQITVLGEQLDGKMWGTGAELDYDLNGKLGAKRRNLFIAGRFSWRGEKHRISLTLNKADIAKPFAFRNVMVSRGSLSGALDVTFSDSVSINSIDANGWIKVGRGSCRIDDLPRPFDSVQLSLSVVNTRCIIDSVSGMYAGTRIQAGGTWDLSARAPVDSIGFRCLNICADSLFVPAADLRESGNGSGILGSGWFRGALVRLKGSDAVLTANAGGVTFGGAPVIGAFARVKFQRKQFDFDSLSIQLPAGSLSGNGVIDYGNTPLAYSFQCAGSIDSLGLFRKECGGNVRFAGEVQGVGGSATGAFTAQGTKILYSGIPLGGVALSAKVRGDSIVFTARNNDRANVIKAGGVFSGIGGSPKVRCTVAVKANGESPLFTGRPAVVPRPDSIRSTVVFKGWENAFDARVSAAVFAPGVHGGVTVNFNRSGGPLADARSSMRGAKRMRERPITWKIVQRDLMKDGVPFDCAGSGSFFSDSLTIDSLILFDRTFTTGKVIFGPAGTMVRVTCTYDVPIKESVGLLFGPRAASIEGGTVSGVVRLSGPIDKLESSVEAHVRDLSVGGFGKLQTDAIITSSGADFKVRPFVLRKDGQVVAEIDTIANAPRLRCAGRVDDIDIRAIFGTLLPEDVDVQGRLTGSFRSSENGFPVMVSMNSPKVMVNTWEFDSVQVAGFIDSAGVTVKKLRATDGPRTVVSADGFAPWALFRDDATEEDTMRASVTAKGDLIATLRNATDGLIDGTGQGTFKLSISGQPENWHVQEGSLLVPKGNLELQPYVAGGIKDFSCEMRIIDSTRVSTLITGTVKKRPFRIFSNHEVPEGFEPLTLGPLDFGVLQIETPHHGIDLHIPGLMEKGETGDFEPTGKGAFKFFTLAGPVTNLNIVGTLIARSVEFTYPMLEDRDHVATHSAKAAESPGGVTNANVASLIKWELDIKPGDHKVIYFRDIANKKTRLMRVIEAYVDQGTSVFRLRGSDYNKTFKITGTVHSYKGVVYYGKTFDRNFDVGVEFVPQKNVSGPGFNNFPIIWGNAEAFSDSGRFDRIKLTALIQDPVTGETSEKGRLAEKFNMVVHVSSDFDEIPGEAERDFYEQAGLQFTTLGRAGKFMSDFGEQALNRMFLQKYEHKLAKTVGLDVISIETSIASNYFNRFYNRQFVNSSTQADYLALANVGLTVGRYFWRDYIFIKARGGLVPRDTALTPEYSLGFEFQPTRYLFMDFDYGFYKGDAAIEQNPRLNLQLRLPISGLRKYLDF
jgi:hypothetical protein